MDRRGMVLIEIIVSMLVVAVSALAVTATVAMVNSKEMRSAGGSSLDLQALNYARQTLESLRDAVSTKTGTGETGAPLVDDSYTAPCSTAVGTACGSGKTYISTLPTSDLQTHSGTRSYKVWDISGGGSTVAYKKVTVTVLWTD
ncbi:MAG: prepilin-type N-terminal cleavage/methylation domain-containing protein [Candidatus Omnitrophota bacterium]